MGTLELIEREGDAAPAPQAGGMSAQTPRQLSVVEYAVQSGAPIAEVRALLNGGAR